MTCFYIKETLEKNKFKLLYKYIFNKIEIKVNSIELPINVNKKIRYRKAKKLVQKLKQNNVRQVVLSNSLIKQEQLKNEMYSDHIDILDGRFLFKILSENIIEYICKKTKLDIKNIEISILVNDDNDLNKSIIFDIAESVKTLNVITNNIKNFKDIEEKLYEDKGIVIKISNNKKKSLLKSNVILNLDFSEEDINLYNIPKTCILINTSYPVKIRTKKFNGININNFSIIIPEEYKILGFNDEIVYESIIYSLDYTCARKKILEDKIVIKNLIGTNGVICNQEFNKLF